MIYSNRIIAYADLVEEYEDPEEYDCLLGLRVDVGLRRTAEGDFRRIQGSAHSSPRPLSGGGASSSLHGLLGGIRSTITSRDGRLCFFSYFS